MSHTPLTDVAAIDGWSGDAAAVAPEIVAVLEIALRRITGATNLDEAILIAATAIDEAMRLHVDR